MRNMLFSHACPNVIMLNMISIKMIQLVVKLGGEFMARCGGGRGVSLYQEGGVGYTVSQQQQGSSEVWCLQAFNIFCDCTFCLRSQGNIFNEAAIDFSPVYLLVALLDLGGCCLCY